MSAVNVVMRMSHTKSKQGCKSCKLRRIKCDEIRPICRNCGRSKRECEYPTTSAVEINQSDLEWTAEVDIACRKWKETGCPQFPCFNLASSMKWYRLSMDDMRYLHHIGTLASILELSQVRHMCAWWGEFPKFMQLSLEHDCVAYAIAAKSAKRLSLVTKNPTALNHAIRYRGLALSGLAAAVKSFSKQNADAILCASIILCDDEWDWRAWKSMTQGIGLICNQIQPWKHESVFQNLIGLQHNPIMDQIQEACQNVKVSASPDEIQQILLEGIQSLNQLINCLTGGHENTDWKECRGVLRQFRDALRLIHHRGQDDWTKDEQFRLINPFTAWLTKYNTSFFSISRADTMARCMNAHIFSVPVLIAICFPAVDTPPFSLIRLQSILRTQQYLEGCPGYSCTACDMAHHTSDVMRFPLKVVSLYAVVQMTNYETYNLGRRENA